MGGGFIFIFVNILIWMAFTENGMFYSFLLFIIIIIKKGRQCKAGRERLTLYQSEDPSPTIPTHRKKEEKGKTVEDTKGREQLRQ